jgi:anaerobic magnesium-protoporphyrin IX monomethyl ester cyclase
VSVAAVGPTTPRRLILVGKYYLIEPLGILYLLGLARQRGWECRVVLVSDGDFGPLYDEVRDFAPSLVGFSVWTGGHGQMFAACDRVRAIGAGVVIGGPHATYFTAECAAHADWVVKGEGFRSFRKILDGESGPGVLFDEERMAEGFPRPDRDLLYRRYPALAASPIKSIFCSIGCPFHCSYCYAPSYNKMYGGFALNLRPVDDIIEEALAIRDHWPLSMIYMQDDIFGFNIPWLREFTQAWRARVGVPWHCQIRLELTRDDERLALFREGGCTGITLAIESGNDFLRRYVLLRPMTDELILEGTRKVQSHGLALRTQQILAVPFSDIETDLESLALNNRIQPDIAWSSILVPYLGTSMGAIAHDFGLYEGNNDDLQETFFSRSVLRHTAGGRAALEPVVRAATRSPQDNPLQRMAARPTGERRAGVYLKDPAFHRVLPGAAPVCEIEYLDEAADARYRDQTVALQRLFNWLARVPQGHLLGGDFVRLPRHEQTWRRLGELTEAHLRALGYDAELVAWRDALAQRFADAGVTPPDGLWDNPYYVCFLPSGPEFAVRLAALGFFAQPEAEAQLDMLGFQTRQWLYDRALYKTTAAEPPLARGGIADIVGA